MGTKRRILLLGNYRPTLALARSLGAAGHTIFVGLEGCDGGAEYSRFTNQVWDHPRLKDNETAFLKHLKLFVAQHDISLIIPVSEDFISCFIRNSSLVEGLAPVAMVDPQLTSKCLDKISMMQRCVRLNVPCAPFAEVDCVANLHKETDRLGVPIVVRSERSTCRLGGRKAVTIETASDVEDLISIWPSSETNLILQKQAAGRRYNVYFAAKAGELVQHVQAVILRTDCPDGSGLALEGETIEPRQDLREYTAALLQDLDYDGIGCAQFLVEEETNEICFLEINARIAGNLVVPETVGLKLTQFLTQDILESFDCDQRIEGRPGVRYVWITGEITAAKVAYLQGKTGIPEFIRTCFSALWSASRADLHMVFSWSDPLPAVMTLIRLFPTTAGVKRRLRSLFMRGDKGPAPQERHMS